MSVPSTSPNSPPRAAGYAALAQQMRAWTTNLLALGVLLVLGLAVGWQIMSWLREEPVPPLVDDAGPPAEVRLLSHGGPLQIDRVRGEMSAVREVLRKRCFETAEQAKPQSVAAPGEARFLARLAKEPPREQSGELELYEPSGEPVMTVLVHRTHRRIVGWGFAFPADDGGWACYTFCPGAAVIPPLPGASEVSGVTQ